MKNKRRIICDRCGLRHLSSTRSRPHSAGIMCGVTTCPVCDHYIYRHEPLIGFILSTAKDWLTKKGWDS